ncbi:Nuclear pore complex protein Nup85 [Zostera marina]|uniref:Nuclear pore complex protein Nup85 n=1 Tax=Zostera marina TaxID=29655 RepID=A0A0K9PSG1_ZOSMR|nr:Nuclear pore complex protein Nup85 [Zostera marina]
MPGLLSPDGKESLVPFNLDLQKPSIHTLPHGLRPSLFRIHISWSRGNCLHVTCLRPPNEDGEGCGGKIAAVTLGGGEGGDLSDAQMRRVAYGSVPAFALLQSQKNVDIQLPRMVADTVRSQWWQHVLDYSNQIKALLGDAKYSPSSVIENPRTVLKPVGELTNLRAAWQLMEIFYADKHSLPWLPESLVDWLADYDSLISKVESTIHSKLTNLQKKLVNLQIVEDDPEYWEGISSALAVGWFDIVVKLLRLHGSYQLDQLDCRETENGLVETVAVLVSEMPRMRPNLSNGKLGQCYKSKSDFVKAWEKWRGHIAKLDCSAFWIQCANHQTRDGLKNMLQIMLGNINSITTYTCNWMELYISHFLYVRPLTAGFDGMLSLAQKCMDLKSISGSCVLTRLILGILGENTEVILAECSRTFGPWMVTHATELLTAENNEAELVLHGERYNLGGISIEELHRLVYAQILSSHTLTWQIAPTYLVSCPKQGLGFLEILLYKQPAHHYQMILKNLEICRLYELDSIGISVMKIAGMHHWKHGRKGFGIYWLQQAHDEVRLNRIANELFDCIGKSVSDDVFKQWEGLIELLGSEVGKAGGLEFLHKYRDFKRSIHLVQDKNSVDAAKSAVEFLMQLMKSPSTPQRFWLSLLHDSVKLLNWPIRPLLNVSQTNLLLNKLQELSMAKLHPGFCNTNLTSEATSSIRLALGANLGRAILEDC